jgi:hypothetical protein
LIWSKRRAVELSPWSREGGASGSIFAITRGAPVTGVRQEVEGGGRVSSCAQGKRREMGGDENDDRRFSFEGGSVARGEKEEGKGPCGRGRVEKEEEG